MTRQGLYLRPSVWRARSRGDWLLSLALGLVRGLLSLAFVTWYVGALVGRLAR